MIAEEDFEKVGGLIGKMYHRRYGFFIRHKTNYEWEVGYGEAAGPRTVRADSLLSALRALVEQEAKESPRLLRSDWDEMWKKPFIPEKT